MPSLVKLGRTGRQHHDHSRRHPHILGAVLDIGIPYTIGALLAVIGVVLFILSATGRALGGRRFY